MRSGRPPRWIDDTLSTEKRCCDELGESSHAPVLLVDVPASGGAPTTERLS